MTGICKKAQALETLQRHLFETLLDLNQSSDWSEATVWPVKEISLQAALPREIVRGLVKHMVDIGHLQFSKYCINEDGFLMGSGYMITRKGVEHYEN